MSPGTFFMPWEIDPVVWFTTAVEGFFIIIPMRKPRQPKLLDWLAFFIAPEVREN